MWHEHGERDLDWQPELQAERFESASRLGQAAMYLTSVEDICREELAANGFISEESKQKLNEAHQARFRVIQWLGDINGRIHEEENR